MVKHKKTHHKLYYFVFLRKYQTSSRHETFPHYLHIYYIIVTHKKKYNYKISFKAAAQFSSFLLHRRMQFIIEFKFNTSILVNHHDEIQNESMPYQYSFFFISTILFPSKA